MLASFRRDVGEVTFRRDTNEMLANLLRNVSELFSNVTEPAWASLAACRLLRLSLVAFIRKCCASICFYQSPCAARRLLRLLPLVAVMHYGCASRFASHPSPCAACRLSCSYIVHVRHGACLRPTTLRGSVGHQRRAFIVIAVDVAPMRD